MDIEKKTINQIIAMIKNGGIGVLPTDTLYGLVGSALIPKTVGRIYRVRRRNKKKPMIVLIEKIDDLARFGVVPDPEQRKHMKRLWPGPVSLIFSCPNKKFEYLHRGDRTIAFRLPADATLRRLLHRTGPLVAPSANIEGGLPSRSIRQAHEYFGNLIDFYLRGRVKRKASSVIDLTAGGIVMQRV